MDKSMGKKGSGMSENKKYEVKGMSGKEFGNAGSVMEIPTNSEKYDLKDQYEYKTPSMGYPAQAWDYKY